MNNYNYNFNKMTRYKTPTPCHNCKFRTSDCHINCIKYNQYLEIHKIEKEQVRKENERHSDSVYRMKQTNYKVSSNIGRSNKDRK